ncbi:unnamed protein product [Scytosiphon promiscuus]
MRMRAEYDRGYTCTTSYNGSLAAANYYFDSACSLKRFHPAEAIECLKGRRMIFLGDSLTNQQGDSLVGMLDWHPEWMPKGGYRNNKKASLLLLDEKIDVDENGNPFYTLVDCYRPPTGSIGSVERCYDLHDTDFPPTSLCRRKCRSVFSTPFYRLSAHHTPFMPGNKDKLGSIHVQQHLETATTLPDIALRSKLPAVSNEDVTCARTVGESASTYQSTFKPADHNRMRALRGHEKEATETDLEEEDNSISVHVRMSSRPKGERWISRAVLDYNETRASDVFVVNFGAHYPATPEGDEEFKQAVFPLLDEMAVLGETATAVWREMSPVHFPSENGSYVNFLAEDLENANTVCCTGTPPKVLDRNVWVENYLRENGLSDRVKILRIYDMSMPRGAAHHTCHLAPPSTMDQTGTESDYCHSNYGPDCTHWSETGVVEEWNAILLNHICPVNE